MDSLQNQFEVSRGLKKKKDYIRNFEMFILQDTDCAKIVSIILYIIYIII